MAEQSLAYKKAKSLVDEWKKLGMTIDKDEEYIISDIQLNLIAVHMDTVKVFSDSNDELLKALAKLVTLIRVFEFESDFDESDTELSDAMKQALQVIAKAKGE